MDECYMDLSLIQRTGDSYGVRTGLPGIVAINRVLLSERCYVAGSLYYNDSALEWRR